MRRARACAEAGADAVFVEAPESVVEMDAACGRSYPRTCRWSPTWSSRGRRRSGPSRSSVRPAIALIVVPVAGLLASAHALRALYAALLADGDTRAMTARMLGFAEMNAFLGLEELTRRLLA